MQAFGFQLPDVRRRDESPAPLHRHLVRRRQGGESVHRRTTHRHGLQGAAALPRAARCPVDHGQHRRQRHEMGWDLRAVHNRPAAGPALSLQQARRARGTGAHRPHGQSGHPGAGRHPAQGAARPDHRGRHRRIHGQPRMLADGAALGPRHPMDAHGLRPRQRRPARSDGECQRHLHRRESPFGRP